MIIWPDNMSAHLVNLLVSKFKVPKVWLKVQTGRPYAYQNRDAGPKITLHRMAMTWLGSSKGGK